MIIRVFVDMSSFLIILFAIILSGTFLDQYFRLLSDNKDTSFTTFIEILRENYFVALGDFQYEEITPYRWVTLMVYTLLLLVIMMNLLIAVISETFSEFVTNKEDYDLLEVINLVEDY